MSRSHNPDIGSNSSKFSRERPNHKQKVVFEHKLKQFREYLETKGKEPKRNVGYAEDSIPERMSRIRRSFRWLWGETGVKTEIGTEELDLINVGLEEDRYCQRNDDPYAPGTKRKINDVLRNWAAFIGEDWVPKYEFSDTGPSKKNTPDPFLKTELKQLTETSLTYRSIPRYNNLSPDERDRWKGHIAQELGKRKEDVSPGDWDRINTSWEIPSLIRTTRAHGWRPHLVGNLKVDWYDSDTKKIYIPAGCAPKNEEPWTVVLTDEEALFLDKWLRQRELIERYDGRDEIWLNRKGNPYDSGPLNDLLDNLLEAAGIEERGRKLVWYSFRHSIGTYIYDEYHDLDMVAEQLRQTTREAASQYVHKLPELKREAAEIM